MATNWFRVHKAICTLHPECEMMDIEETLRYLYMDRRQSLADIMSMTNREILSPRTLHTRLLHIKGVEIRGKGGDNSSKSVPLTFNDLKENSVRELARKYDVHVTTIYARKRKLFAVGDKEITDEKNTL